MEYPYHQRCWPRPARFVEKWCQLGKYKTEHGYMWISYNRLHQRLRWAKTRQRKRYQLKRCPPFSEIRWFLRNMTWLRIILRTCEPPAPWVSDIAGEPREGLT